MEQLPLGWHRDTFDKSRHKPFSLALRHPGQARLDHPPLSLPDQDISWKSTA